MFVPKGKGHFIVNDFGDEIVITDDDGTETTVRAKLEVVDKTTQNIFKKGVRPDVDIVAYVKNTITVQRGWKAMWNSTQYEIAEVEDQRNDIYRLLLQEQKTGGIDLTT